MTGGGAEASDEWVVDIALDPGVRRLAGIGATLVYVVAQDLGDVTLTTARMKRFGG